MKPTELVAKLLSNATNLDICKELVADDATYVSLNYDDPDLASVSRLRTGPDDTRAILLIDSRLNHGAART